MVQKFTFLFAAIEAVGHINASTGIAQQLLSRGHRVVFATPMSWKGKLEVHGFIEELYQGSEKTKEPGDTDTFAQMFGKLAHAARLPPIERHERLHLEMYEEMFESLQLQNTAFLEIMNRVKPDVVIVDFDVQIPALMNQGVPWVLSCSCNPLMMCDDNVAPAFSGYPVDGDKEEFKKFRDKGKSVFRDIFQKFKTWVSENGGPELEYTYPYWLKHSEYANIYMYPMELDYTSERPNPPNWHRFDAFVRETAEKFEVPEKLKTGQGKLVYFSMGTIGSADIDLMKRLIKILAKSPNRFIVSKGTRGDELQLADNMWGENSVPQTRVLPLVDLVITHGGNNTVTESFYFGKRMLVLGHLWDQLDNAQRIHESGLGLRLHPYEASEEELLSSIEQLLGDELLERRMKSISKRIQSTKSQSAAADLIESIATNNRVS